MLTRVERGAGWLIAILVLLLLGSTAWSVIHKWQHVSTVRLGNAVLSTDVADTDSARAEGLGGRDKLGMNDGMLFVYDRDGRWGIWMKNMKFAIDIVWLNKDKRVVHIIKNVYPDTYPDVFKPDTEARYVLEVPAGTVEAKNIRINQAAHFDLPAR
jgi:uncharacterized membrane protein (UPF0127 family)